MTTSKRRLLVTSALPYANGSLHLGHMLEHIQTDIWVRYQKLVGNDCLYICGEDAHGTPIMVRAQKEGITPEKLIADMQQEHEADLNDFNIAFDNYYTTHSSENKAFAETTYQRLTENGDITSRTIEQAFDPEKNMFLPDRFVKGTCPRCHAEDQYGDNCEVCGATYSPTELINPQSTLSGATPIQKESLHYFFDLPKYQPILEKWLSNDHLQQPVINKLQEWFEAGLQQWDISRDAPYFGFEIPDAPGKYFYVWLDAPIGYMASFKNYCDKNENANFDDYWQTGTDTELYHFVGKDIIYFHALFWPAMLTGANYRTPTSIYTHGFLTINGSKMSKSRGTFITARRYLEHLNPEYLRYYFAAKLSDGVDDIDLSFADFTQRVNADLVGKVVNIASRCAGFIKKHFDGKLSDTLDTAELYSESVIAGETIASYYEKRQYGHAVRSIMQLADSANQYIDQHKPWQMAKVEETKAQVQPICTTALNLFRLLVLYLQPILPSMSENALAFLNDKNLQWNQRNIPLTSHTIKKFKPLMQRITPEQIDALLEKNE